MVEIKIDNDNFYVKFDLLVLEALRLLLVMHCDESTAPIFMEFFGCVFGIAIYNKSIE